MVSFEEGVLQKWTVIMELRERSDGVDDVGR